MLVVSNAFSIQMLTGSATVDFRFIDVEEAKEMVKGGFESSLGHKDIAGIVSTMLGVEIVPQRRQDKLVKGDILLVAQYMGGRLPEGATSLPEGAEIRFVRVEVL